MSDLQSIYDPNRNINNSHGVILGGFGDLTPSIILGRSLNRQERSTLYEDTSLVYAANEGLKTLDYRLSVLEQDVEALLMQMVASEVPDVFAIPPIDRHAIEITLIDEGFAPFRYIEAEEDI